MNENNVVELNSETLYYIPKAGAGSEIIGVGDSSGAVEFIDNKVKGVVNVFVEGAGQLSQEKFKSLCIAWLALNYPDTLKYDDE